MNGEKDEDWIPGQKNRNGVYCPTETLDMPRATKGWRGCHRVSIALAQTADGWRSHRSFSFFTGHCWGSGGPITDESPLHPTREAAIAEQVAHLRRQFAKLGIPSMQKEAAEMLEWADGLNPVQMEMFA